MYIFGDLNKIVKNQDLYRNKDDFEFFECKVLNFDVKDFIFYKYTC